MFTCCENTLFTCAFSFASKTLSAPANLLNPLNILEQGYSIVKKDNEIIKNTAKININDKLDVTLAKGTLKVKVEEINDERNDV